jgi:hypothetical protein
MIARHLLVRSQELAAHLESRLLRGRLSDKDHGRTNSGQYLVSEGNEIKIILLLTKITLHTTVLNKFLAIRPLKLRLRGTIAGHYGYLLSNPCLGCCLGDVRHRTPLYHPNPPPSSLLPLATSPRSQGELNLTNTSTGNPYTVSIYFTNSTVLTRAINS